MRRLRLQARWRLLALLLLLAGALPAGLAHAQEATPSPAGATPAPAETAAGTPCPHDGQSAGPTGTFIETRTFDQVVTGSPSQATTAAGRVICIDPSAGDFTLQQSRYATTLIVMSGELSATLVGPFLDAETATLPVASYFPADAPEGTRALNPGQPVALQPGAMLVVASVEISLEATSGPVRVLVLGILDDTGGGCPPCAKWPPP